MKLRQLLTMSLLALFLACSPLAASAGPPGHSRHHQKHSKHNKQNKHHKYAKRHKHHNHHGHKHHQRHDHEHVVIVESYRVREPKPHIGVQVGMGGGSIEGIIILGAE